MTTPGPVQTDRDFYSESTLNLSPLTPRDRDAVPIGTVAARIMELHNLAKVSAFNVSPLAVSHHPENSRIGFGRRVDSRFGKPASRSCAPDGDTQEDTKHSFLGLNTHRSNHMEAHAFVDGRAKWNRTAGLHRRLQPSGSKGVVPNQTTTSSDILPKRDFRRESPSAYNEKEAERIRDSCRKSRFNIVAPKLSLPNLPQYIIPRVSFKQEEPFKARFQESRQYQSADQQKIPTVAESQSTERASTLQRQSLRDLYYSYNIHRPAGLVMSQKVTFGLEDTARYLSKHEFCEACSCTLPVCAMNCTSGVSLCENCQSLSPAAMNTSDGSDESIENKPKYKGEHLQREKPTAQLLDTETTKGNGCEQPNSLLEGSADRGGLRHLDEKDRFQYTEGESNSIVQKLPLPHFEETTPRCGSLESLRRNAQLPDSSQVYQQTVPAELLHSAQDTISVSKVDTILSTRSPNIVTISTQLSNPDTQILHHSHHQRQEGHQSRGSRSNSSSRDERSSGNDNCDTSGCPAIDQGFVQYRQGITCRRKRRKYPEETDSGYIAGASHLEEPELLPRDTNQNRICGNGIQGHYTTSIEYLSPNPNTCASLVDETRVYGDKHLTHQTAYAKHAICSPSIITRVERVPHAQQLPPTAEQRTLTKKAAAWTLDSPQSCDLQEKMTKNQHDDKIADSSCDCKRCKSEHRIQQYAGGIAYANNHDNKENTLSGQRLTPRSTTPILANVESSLVRPESPSKLAPSCLMTTNPGAKIYMDDESPDRLKKSPMVSSHDTAYQEILMSKNQSKEGSQESFGEIIKENLANLPSDPSANIKGVQATNFDSFTDAVTQDSLDTLARSPGTAAEHDQPTQCVDLRTDITTDMAQSMPIHTSGDLSPSKFKPTSRRLSAFFKLQEQNVVSILNKRLQDHQEALKRAETICNDRVNDRINAAIQSLSLDHEQNHEPEIERNASRLESLRGNTVGKYELDLPNSNLQLEQQEAKVDRLETPGREGEQNPSFMFTHMIDRGQEHDCAWKQTVMKHNSGVAQNPYLCSENKTTLTRDKGSDVGINGITIVIHLEGRESVVIKADLSQGI